MNISIGQSEAASACQRQVLAFPSGMPKPKAVIFDWAGTTVDFGCMCPVQAFQDSLLSIGVNVSSEEVRRFMGTHKKDHLRALLSLPRVLRKRGLPSPASIDEEEIERLFPLLEQRMSERVADFSDPVPGLLETVEKLGRRGVKIGSTTGYTAAMMRSLKEAAAGHGYHPACVMASDEVPQGRPAPWMIFRNMETLGVYPPASCVKVGDTPVDMAEARNAGTWAVGVVASSSLVGKTLREWQTQAVEEREKFRTQARQSLLEAGAHYVIEDLAGLENVLDKIESLP